MQRLEPSPALDKSFLIFQEYGLDGDIDLRTQYRIAEHERHLLQIKLDKLDDELQDRKTKKARSRAVSFTRLKQMKLLERIRAKTFELVAIEAAIEDLERYKTREDRLKRLTELGQAVEAAKSDYEKGLSRADHLVNVQDADALELRDNRVLNAQLEEVTELYQSLRQRQQNFVYLANQLAPGISALKTTAAYRDPEKAKILIAEVEDLKDVLREHELELECLLKVIPSAD